MDAEISISRPSWDERVFKFSSFRCENASLRSSSRRAQHYFRICSFLYILQHAFAPPFLAAAGPARPEAWRDGGRVLQMNPTTIWEAAFGHVFGNGDVGDDVDQQAGGHGQGTWQTSTGTSSSAVEEKDQTVEVPVSCSQRYGQQMLGDWRRNAFDIIGTRKSKSGVTCHLRQNWSSPRWVCVARHVRVLALEDSERRLAHGMGYGGEWLTLAGGPSGAAVLQMNRSEVVVDETSTEEVGGAFHVRNFAALMLGRVGCEVHEEWGLFQGNCVECASVERMMFFGGRVGLAALKYKSAAAFVKDPAAELATYHQFLLDLQKTTTTTTSTADPSTTENNRPRSVAERLREFQRLVNNGVRSRIDPIDRFRPPSRSCRVWRKRALLHAPWDLMNFYEWMGDWVQLMETMLMLQWAPPGRGPPPPPRGGGVDAAQTIREEELDLLLVLNPERQAWFAKSNEWFTPRLRYEGGGYGGAPGVRGFNRAWAMLFGRENVRVGTTWELFGEPWETDGGICYEKIATVGYGGLTTFSANGGRQGEAKPRCPAPTVIFAVLVLEALARTADHLDLFQNNSPAEIRQRGSPVLPLKEFWKSFQEPPTSRKTSEDKPVSGTSDDEDSTTTRNITVLLRPPSKTDGRHFTNDSFALHTVHNAIPPSLRQRWRVQSLALSSRMTLGQQIDVARHTQVLVSTHGAGLTVLLWLAPRARVVEISCGNKGLGERHYKTLTQMVEGESARANWTDMGKEFLLRVNASSRSDEGASGRAGDEQEGAFLYSGRGSQQQQRRLYFLSKSQGPLGAGCLVDPRTVRDAVLGYETDVGVLSHPEGWDAPYVEVEKNVEVEKEPAPTEGASGAAATGVRGGGPSSGPGSRREDDNGAVSSHEKMEFSLSVLMCCRGNNWGIIGQTHLGVSVGIFVFFGVRLLRRWSSCTAVTSGG